jgi:hypothetical protein
VVANVTEAATQSASAGSAPAVLLRLMRADAWSEQVLVNAGASEGVCDVQFEKSDWLYRDHVPLCISFAITGVWAACSMRGTCMIRPDYKRAGLLEPRGVYGSDVDVLHRAVAKPTSDSARRHTTEAA